MNLYRERQDPLVAGGSAGCARPWKHDGHPARQPFVPRGHVVRRHVKRCERGLYRIADLREPLVRQLAPKLMRALDRAISYCQQTLAYGRAQEPLPERKTVSVEHLVEEVRDTLNLNKASRIGWVPSIERGLMIDADPEQMFRVLLNLCRNSSEALQTRVPNEPARDQVRVVGRREGAVVVLEVADTGPGLPPRSREHLFEPFHGSMRSGGTGLGLAIAAEIVRLHGGEISLLDGTIGAAFRISIPDRPAQLDTYRESRLRA